MRCAKIKAISAANSVLEFFIKALPGWQVCEPIKRRLQRLQRKLQHELRSAMRARFAIQNAPTKDSE